MWKSIAVSNNLEEDYFFKIITSTDNDDIQFYLTDLKNMWETKQTKEQIVKNAKTLNKRIEFDPDKIIDTIKTEPHNVELQEITSYFMLRKQVIIKNKYYVSGRPFSFNWNLSLCNQNELKQLITIPLLVKFSLLQKQNEELLKIIEKKDIEITQFKSEGCILVRSSVSTKPINIDNFKNSNLFMLCDERLKKFEEICKDDLEEGTKVNDDVNLTELLQPIKAIQKSPIKSKKRRLIKKRDELAEKRLRIADKKISYYESPSYLAEDVECNNNGAECNTSTVCVKNNVEIVSNTNIRGINNLEIEQIKNSLAELNRKSDNLLKEERLRTK